MVTDRENRDRYKRIMVEPGISPHIYIIYDSIMVFAKDADDYYFNTKRYIRNRKGFILKA